MEKEEKERQGVNKRLWGLGAAVVVIISILTANLWRLQIVNAAYYTAKANSNFNQMVSIPATRGDILDNSGNLLATSVPKFVLSVEWLELHQAGDGQWQNVIHQLAEYIKPYWTNQKETVESIYEDILATIQNHQWERYKTVELLQSDDQGLRAIVAEHQEELPGITVSAVPVRSYPQKTLMGHILGYVREISDQEIDQFNKLPDVQAEGLQYVAGDIVGKSGIEKSYDIWLRGKEGQEQIETDSNGHPIEKKVVQEPEAGKTVQLTINSDLQKAMEDSMEEVLAEVRADGHPDANAAAAVAIDVNTGKVLAMASHPAMDPNDLIGTISDETAEKYFTDQRAASLNRAISGTYAPGSTFKMITGMAALQAGLTTPQEEVDDRMSSLGSNYYQSQGFEEWGNNYFGMVDLKKAISHSSDIYFEVMGERVFSKSPEYVGQVANEFGLGVTSGIDLPAEAVGISPTPAEKQKYYVPLYKQQREQGLADIEAKYKDSIANAKDAGTKENLEKEKQKEIDKVEATYKQQMNVDALWHEYDSYNASIGQGLNAFTPLQLANYVATIANGGKRYQPYVVDKIIDPASKKVVKQNEPKLLNTVSISQENLEAIKQGMAATITDPTATAYGLFSDIPNFTGGAKTGTAQIGSKNTIAGETYNGVFVAFAPYDHPQIAFAAVVEYGTHGVSTAGKIADAVFAKYFEGK